MSNYRRALVPGGTFFFTVVTFGRRPLLATSQARQFLHEALARTRAERPFRTLASVLLPDHLHEIWTLPRGDDDFPTRWRLIKTRVTQAFHEAGLDATNPRPTRRRRHQHALWQPRFWEHVIREDEDLRRHVDYIHWNPVRHGLAKRVRDWRWSTFHAYVQRDVYPLDWGAFEPPGIADLEIDGE